MIELAKQAVDIGLFTNHCAQTLSFWQQQARIPFSELLPLGAGLRQHRHAIGESVLKINESREVLADAPPAGIRRLLIAQPGLDTVTELSDPEGNAVVLVPPGHDGITQLRVELTVNDIAAHRQFYGHALGLPALDPDTFACGVSQIRLEAGTATRDPVQAAPGYRYLTIQVYDVRGVHAGVLARGGREGRPPVKLGEVAHISFVRDPDGNWIEVSQRKSLTGSLD